MNLLQSYIKLWIAWVLLIGLSWLTVWIVNSLDLGPGWSLIVILSSWMLVVIPLVIWLVVQLRREVHFDRRHRASAGSRDLHQDG